jgi:hypothetical protein
MQANGDLKRAVDTGDQPHEGGAEAQLADMMLG